MKNWSGTVRFNPEVIHRPKSQDEIVGLVKSAHSQNKNIRLIGSGHSWTALIKTTNILISLNAYQGIIEIDREKKTAVVKAGTKLKTLGAELFRNGLAMENLGDIDVQSIAGAASTGTHGTGIDLQSISNQIIELTLVTASGELITCSAQTHPEIFYAARVCVGTLGIISTIKLQLIDSYKLEVLTKPEPMDICLTKWEQYCQNNRHFEVFYFPISEMAIVKTMNKSQGKIQHNCLEQWFNDQFLENWCFELFNWVASKFNLYSCLSKLLTKFLSPRKFTNWSQRAFATKRSVRFYEMEYGFKHENFNACFKEIRDCIRKYQIKTLFPIEIRMVKKDLNWLSPTYERNCIYIAIHMYITENTKVYFKEIEKIFQRYQGLPHWGKMHQANADYFSKNYPKWNEFEALRKKLDPNGMFLNDYLKEIFDSN